MDPVLSAALRSWDLRLEVIIVLAAAGIIYSIGWWRLRTRTAGSRVAGRVNPRRVNPRRVNRWHAGARWRPAVYILGLLLLAIALMSPIDVLSAQMFTMHMIQHLFLVMIVPPLLLLANPLPYWLWGMPKQARLAGGRLLSRQSRFRSILRQATGPGLVWMAFVIVYWGWHDPNAYQWALRSSFAHDFEHISFFLVSMLFWWHIVGAGPKIHRPLSPIGRAGYALAAIPPNMLAGLAFVFAAAPIYEYYEAMPRLWGLSVMEDQRIAGLIMWVPGSMMFLIAALIMVARWLQIEEKKPPLPESAWATDEALAAPGIATGSRHE
jgi:cytochrome c oxidase assembly factor CtaG